MRGNSDHPFVYFDRSVISKHAKRWFVKTSARWGTVRAERFESLSAALNSQLYTYCLTKRDEDLAARADGGVWVKRTAREIDVLKREIEALETSGEKLPKGITIRSHKCKDGQKTLVVSVWNRFEKRKDVSYAWSMATAKALLKEKLERRDKCYKEASTLISNTFGRRTTNTRQERSDTLEAECMSDSDKTDEEDTFPKVRLRFALPAPDSAPVPELVSMETAPDSSPVPELVSMATAPDSAPVPELVSMATAPDSAPVPELVSMAPAPDSAPVPELVSMAPTLAPVPSEAVKKNLLSFIASCMEKGHDELAFRASELLTKA
jgi:hypothetical protein